MDYLEAMKAMRELPVPELPDDSMPIPGIHYPDTPTYKEEERYQIRIPVLEPDYTEKEENPKAPPRGFEIIEL